MNDFQIISSKMENKGQSHREEGFPPQLAVLRAPNSNNTKIMFPQLLHIEQNNKNLFL